MMLSAEPGELDSHAFDARLAQLMMPPAALPIQEGGPVEIFDVLVTLRVQFSLGRPWSSQCPASRLRCPTWGFGICSAGLGAGDKDV